MLCGLGEGGATVNAIGLCRGLPPTEESHAISYASITCRLLMMMQAVEGEAGGSASAGGGSATPPPPRVDFFRTIVASFGDGQSIAEGLSTFAAHVQVPWCGDERTSARAHERMSACRVSGNVGASCRILLIVWHT